MVERALGALAAGAAAIGAAALAGLFVLVLAAVVMRYGWGRPFPFTEELAGLLMTVAVFTLLPVTVSRELHIRVTVLTGRLPPAVERAAFVLSQALLVAFATVFVREAWAIAEFSAMLNLKSEQSRLPLAPFLYVSTGSMALAGLIGAWRAWHRVASAPQEPA
jgi:TRAP-type C4-dicarboxylate transport system permease small subunit